MDEETRARFEQVDARFEQVDARFDDVDARMKAGFGAVDARFDGLEAFLARHFEHIEQRLDEHGRRFDALEARMDRLEARVDGLEARMKSFETSVAERFQSVDEQIRATQRNLDRLADALRTDLLKLEDGTIQVRADMNERFGRLEKGMEALTLGELRERMHVLSERVDHLGGSVVGRLEGVEKELSNLTGQVNGLTDDMRQRFRAVNDRLVDIDRRLAA